MNLVRILRACAVAIALLGAVSAATAGEARCTGLGANCMCSEPMNGPESAVLGLIRGGFDFVSSDNASECWGRGSGFLGFDTSANQQVVSVNNWGSARYAVRQTTGFFWMYGKDPFTLTSNDKTVCYRYYKQVDADYGSAGGDYGNPAGSCPNSTWRNKLMQSEIGGQQVQLEEDASYSCPAVGQFNGISISVDNGPSSGNYALQPRITLGSCVSAPCRIEYCVDGNITAGTGIRYRAQIVPVATGVVHAAMTPTISPGGGPSNKYVWGGDMFHSSPRGDANHGFFMNAVWQSIANQWIGAASEVEGGSGGGTGGGTTPVAPSAPVLLP